MKHVIGLKSAVLTTIRSIRIYVMVFLAQCLVVDEIPIRIAATIVIITANIVGFLLGASEQHIVCLVESLQKEAAIEKKHTAELSMMLDAIKARDPNFPGPFKQTHKNYVH